MTHIWSDLTPYQISLELTHLGSEAFIYIIYGNDSLNVINRIQIKNEKKQSFKNVIIDKIPYCNELMRYP